MTRTDDGPGLQLLVDWEPGPGVTSAELAATWCRLEIRVGDRLVTAVVDERNGAFRRGVYTSAYPLAEWIAEHWWALRVHVRPSSVARSAWSWANVREQRWLRAHNLRAAGGGMPWPDLTLVPEGSATRLQWTAGPGLAGPVEFLTSGDAFLSSNSLADSLSRFVEQVLDRLKDGGVTGTRLQEEWATLADSDPEEEDFSAAAARLGLDPFDIDAQTEASIVALATDMSPELLAELLDSVDAEHLPAAAQWLGDAREQLTWTPRPRLEMPRSRREAFAGEPWRVGYEAARAYRVQLGVAPRDVFELARYTAARVQGPGFGIQGLVAVEPEQIAIVLPEDEGVTRPALRFAVGRSLGLSLLTDRNEVLLESAHTDLAKASRAFAAELLAPAEGISEYLSVLQNTTPGAFEAIAARFEASPLLVQLQYDNQIAR